MRTSRKAIVAFLAGLLSVACGLLALITESNLFLVGVVLFWILALGRGWYGQVEIGRSTGKLTGKTLAGWGMAVASAGIALWLFVFPSICVIETAAARQESRQNMQRLTDALLAYADDHERRLPPAVLYDEAGRPMHSWRVLILPYLGENALYQEFRLDEPWDSPHNLTLVSRMPKVYAPPSGLMFNVRAEAFATFYQVFVGKGTAFEGRVGLSYSKDFPDGASNTILLIEAGHEVLWTKPADLAYEADRPLPTLGGIFNNRGRCGLFGPDNRGVHAAFVDGSIRVLPLVVNEKALRNAITRNDGQPGGDL